MRIRATLLPVLLLVSPTTSFAKTCLRDADCGQDEQCRLTESGGSADCSGTEDSEACQAQADSEWEEESSGECVPGALTCTEKSDCPEPTVCEDQLCVYRLKQCTSDAVCADDYECTVIARTGCAQDPVSNAPPAPMPSAAGTQDGAPPTDGAPIDESMLPHNSAPDAPEGANDPATATSSTSDEASEEGIDAEVARDKTDGDAASMTTDKDCEEVVVSACMPIPVPCDGDEDCAGDWSCEELHDDGPENWSGLSKACLPPGLVALLDERVQIDSSGLDIELEGSTSGDVDDSSGGPHDDDEVTAKDISLPEIGTQGGSEGNSDSCAATPAARASFSWMWLPLALSMLRRRRETRDRHD